MANWNSGYMFNTRAEHGGFFWNGASYILLLRINEVLKFNDKITQNLARLVLLDKMDLVEENLIQTALFKQTDKFHVSDKMTYSRMLEITDQIGITDDFSALLVLAALADRFDIIDQARMLGALIETEDVFRLDEEITLKSFLDTIDSFGFDDLSEVIQVLISAYDAFGMTDNEPRQAVSDFILGVSDNLDNAYDWLIPFKMKVDWNSTNIQIMPEASHTTIEMPGIDGSILENTVYKDRLFQIVAFSEEGLSKAEKQELKAKITEILDSTKHQSKKLTVQASGNSFDVKYDGQAVITEGPSYVKATIPLRTPPYGYKTFEGELYGSGLVNNEGDAEVGVRHRISGPITNPSFTLGETTYSWTGNVPSGSYLVIDHQMMTCFLQNEYGVKTNAMSKLNGSFQKIPAHSSVVLSTKNIGNNQILTTWKDKVLW